MQHTTKFRRGIIIASIGLALGAGALAGAAASKADAETLEELAYITALDEGGIVYSTEDAAIGAGYATCRGFAAGMTFFGVLAAATESSGYTPGEAGFIIGAATAAFCPEYMYKITGATVGA